MGRQVQIGGLACTVSHGNMFKVQLPVRKSFPLSEILPPQSKPSVFHLPCEQGSLQALCPEKPGL